MNETSTEHFIDVPIEMLHRGRFQTRRRFPEDELTDLAISIQRDGLIQPIVVRPLSDPPDHFEIIAGERRWRAIQAIGQDHIRAILRDDIDDQAAWRVCMAENLHRESLSPIEEARGYQDAIDAFGFTHERISKELQATKLVHKRSTVTNRLRLLQLPEPVQDLIHGGELGVQQGLALATNKISQADKIKLAKDCVRSAWTSRQLLGELRKREPGVSTNNGRDNDITALERHISDTIGTKVTLSRSKLTIHYGANNEVLAGILERLGVELDS